MRNNDFTESRPPEEIDERIWPRIYLGVIGTTAAVIALLWYFSFHFSR
jgi:hypothetical protein